jgi:hypothetical protein
MPANNDPIFTKSGDVAKDAGTAMAGAITLAANDFTGAGANNVLVFTADATNGSFIQRLRLKAIGTNVASVMRVFINNGAANTTASNNSFIGEISLPATTTSAVAPVTPDFDYPLNMVLPAGFRIYVGLATAVAAGWVVTPVAGKY